MVSIKSYVRNMVFIKVVLFCCFIDKSIAQPIVLLNAQDEEEHECSCIIITYYSDTMLLTCPILSITAVRNESEYTSVNPEMIIMNSNSKSKYIIYDCGLNDNVFHSTYIVYLIEKYNGLNCINNTDTIQIDTFSYERNCYWQYIPNVFTPNGDGINDYFDTDIKIYHEVLIYNRWGQLVFQSNYPDVKWDGGNYPAGTYYYHIEIPLFERTISKKGTVTLIR